MQLLPEHEKSPRRLAAAGEWRCFIPVPAKGSEQAESVAVAGGFSQFLFNPEKAVIFGHTVGTAQGAGFDLSGIGPYGNIRDGGILRFPGTVGNNGGITVAHGQFHGVQRFRQRAYLIDFHQDGVAHAQMDAFSEEFHIGDKEVIPDKLSAFTQFSVRIFHPSQSFSAQPSSMETMGYFFFSST